MADKEKIERESRRLKTYRCPIVDGRSSPPVGVLLSDEIEHCVDQFKMIDPFSKTHLKAAGYELTIGDECLVEGKKVELGKSGKITIEPFNVVVIKTAETINLPRYLIARWNIRVKWAYEGLLWVGAAQVDPGWVGNLFCPIYNLSNRPVDLHAGEEIALMDFVTTTGFTEGKSISYVRPPKRLLLDEYNENELKSALYQLTKTQLTGFETRIGTTEKTIRDETDKLQNRIDAFVYIVFAVVGVLVGAISLVFSKGNTSTSWWEPSVFWACGGAIFLSMLAWLNARRQGPQVRPQPWEFSIVAAVILIGIFAGVTGQRKISALSRQLQEMRQELDHIHSPTSPSPAVDPISKK